MAARFTAEDYRGALQRLMPRGRVWPQDPDAVQSKVALGLARTAERLDAAAVALLVDIFPATTEGLLPEWEASLALPDAGVGPGPDLAHRQAQVAARFGFLQGQAAERFVAFAALFGIAVVVTSLGPFRVGQNRVGQPLGGEDWSHAWSIEVQDSSAFTAWELDMLEANLRRMAPAHTVLAVTYA